MKPLHKKAQVVVAAINSSRQAFDVLLLQTNQQRGSFWQNVTGKLDAGETFEEAALRETQEETGVALEAIVDFVDLQLTHEFVDQRQRRCLEHSFLMVVEAPFAVTLDPHEHQASRWLPLEEVTEQSVKFTGNFESLQRARELLFKWGR
jgi:ADP-ribose pyrophosphatase YjhB (NUDIX family)